MNSLRLVNKSQASSVCATIASVPVTTHLGEKYPCRFLNVPTNHITMQSTVLVEGQRLKCLHDTGAGISAMNPQVLNNLSFSVHRISQCTPFRVKVSIDDKIQHYIDRCAEVVVDLQERRFLWRFFLVPGLQNDFIFGTDFLYAYHVTVDVHKQKLVFGVPIENNSSNFTVPPQHKNKTVSFLSQPRVQITKIQKPSVLPTLSQPIHKPAPSFDALTSNITQSSQSTTTTGVPSLSETLSSNTNDNKIRITRTCRIKPNSMQRIPVFTSGHRNDDILITPRRELECAKHIAIGKTIISLINSQGFTYIANLTNKPVKICRNLPIGTFDVFDNSQIICNLDDLEQLQAESLQSLQNENQFPSQNQNFATSQPYYTSPVPELDFNVKMNPNLSEKQNAELKKLLFQYSDIFVKHPDDLTRTHLAKHYIDTGNSMPIRQRPYRASFKERQEISKHCADMLSRGIIEPSCSPWASPVVLVSKPDGTWRFCCDFRKLNAVSKKDSYPMCRIDDALDRLKGATVFSSMDCDQAYYQVEVNQDDKEKTAFVTPDGFYQWNVMAFGLCNAPATFSRLIDNVLGQLKWTIALVYLDDIVCFSRNFDEHLEHLALIFQALRMGHLKLKPSKCSFAESKLKYLGHIVSADGIEVNPETTDAVMKFPCPDLQKTRPAKVKAVQSFVSLCSYYRRFIYNFAAIAAPLRKLTMNDVPFIWDDDCELAFQTLKNKLTSPPVLGYPDATSPTEIHSDACKGGLGATLSQIQDGVERVIAYASRSLDKLERTYGAPELEALAIIYAIEHFKPYVYGRKFTVVTDHHSLCSLLRMKDPKDRLARWILRLQPFDFEIKHKAGRLHTDVDPLSRNPVNPPDSQNDPLEIDDKMFSLQLADSDKITMKEIGRLQIKDKRLAPIIEKVKERTEFPKHPSECLKDPIADYSLRNGILYHVSNDEDSPLWLICIPSKLRGKILNEVHDTTLRHLGFYKTYAFLRSKYFWPNMYTHCHRYVQSCKKCQFHNRRNFNVPGPLQPVAPPSLPFYRIGIDFQGPFPKTWPNRNQYVFVAVDHLTRWVEAWPTKNIDTQSAIAVLEKHVIFRHSCPIEILADRGSCFTSAVFRKWCTKHNIKLLFTAAYKPDTNGVCERKNDVLKSILAKHVNKSHNNWDQLVQAAAYAANIAKHKITKFSPFQLLYGHDPNVPSKVVEPFFVDDNEQLEPVARRTRQQRNLRTARDRTITFQKQCKALFDLKHKPITYRPGDKVLFMNVTCGLGLVRKWCTKWIGPFVIVRRTAPNNYEVRDTRPNSKKPLRIVSVRHLKPYYDGFRSNSDLTDTDDFNFLTNDISHFNSNDETDSDFSVDISRRKRNDSQCRSRIFYNSKFPHSNFSNFNNNDITARGVPHPSSRNSNSQRSQVFIPTRSLSVNNSDSDSSIHSVQNSLLNNHSDFHINDEVDTSSDDESVSKNDEPESDQNMSTISRRSTRSRRAPSRYDPSVFDLSRRRR
jgi:transposase InsO family protein